MNQSIDGSSQRHPQEADWNRIANSARFQQLRAIKKHFIVPVFFFFFAYYLSLPILIGYAPRLASTRIVGTVTLAYLFALSQFVVGWTIAWLYLKASSRFDELVDDVLRQEVPEHHMQRGR
jgi:uncharacterized membrane protein (DUF485 family)